VDHIMNSSELKGRLLTLSAGFVVLAGLLFVILQWGVDSTYSLYGKPMEGVNTLYLVVGAAVGGQIFLLACRLLLKGMLILRRNRREEARIRAVAAGAAQSAQAGGVAEAQAPRPPRAPPSQAPGPRGQGPQGAGPQGAGPQGGGNSPEKPS
jgi:hypothetical protein